MREALLGFILVFIAYFVEFSSATVALRPFSLSFPDLPAKFARAMNKTGVCGALEVADPLDACTRLRNEFGSNKTDPIRLALIIRGDCSFEEKIRNAQSGGFSAAIVYDDKDRGSLVYMTVNPKGIEVMAVFVSKSAGEFLKANAKGEKGECCIYPPRNGKAWTVFAICFLSLLIIAAFLVIALIAPRSLSNWRRRNLVRTVDIKMVEALPHMVFSSARLNQCSTGETCAICLEDYRDGEILKILPCRHDKEERQGLESIIGHDHSACVPSACEDHPCQKFVSAPLPRQNYGQNVQDDANVTFFNVHSSGSEVVTIDVNGAKNLLESGHGFIDVRTVEEYKKGHVVAEKILNIPYWFNTSQGWVKNPEFVKEVSSLCEEDDPLVVGCQCGVRSLHATTDLLSIGFKNVSNMGGGYIAWLENGFPLKTEEPTAKVEEKPKEEL
ncbi:hypothetical protein DITRI_Ditri16bG0007500 [Diplodiscus trichospermus]